MKNQILVLIFITVSALGCKAQDTLTGTLDTWNHDNVDVIMLVGFSGPPITIGEINAQGEFNIPLTADIFDKMTQAMEEQNKSDASGSMELNTLEKAYSCFGEDTIAVENGDQQALTLAMMGTVSLANVQQKQMYGSFMATNSRAFAESFMSFGEQDAVKGFYIDWYYVDESASVTGKCATKTYAMNQEDSYDRIMKYDMNLKAGWNAVKISLDETYTDSDGKVYAAEWMYQTVEELPQETAFLYFQE